MQHRLAVVLMEHKDVCVCGKAFLFGVVPIRQNKKKNHGVRFQMVHSQNNCCPKTINKEEEVVGDRKPGSFCAAYELAG